MRLISKRLSINEIILQIFIPFCFEEAVAKSDTCVVVVEGAGISEKNKMQKILFQMKASWTLVYKKEISIII